MSAPPATWTIPYRAHDTHARARNVSVNAKMSFDARIASYRTQWRFSFLLPPHHIASPYERTPVRETNQHNTPPGKYPPTLPRNSTQHSQFHTHLVHIARLHLHSKCPHPPSSAASPQRLHPCPRPRPRLGNNKHKPNKAQLPNPPAKNTSSRRLRHHHHHRRKSPIDAHLTSHCPQPSPQQRTSLRRHYCPAVSCTVTLTSPANPPPRPLRLPLQPRLQGKSLARPCSAQNLLPLPPHPEPGVEGAAMRTRKCGQRCNKNCKKWSSRRITCLAPRTQSVLRSCARRRSPLRRLG